MIRRKRTRIAAFAAILAASAFATPAQAIDWTSSGSFPAADGDGVIPLGVAVNQGTGDVYLATPFTPAFGPGQVKRFDSAGVQQGGFGLGIFTSVALNQANGNVHALDPASFGGYPPHVQTFTAAGAPAAPPFLVPPNTDGAFPQIAIDSDGNVYYPDAGTDAVHRFAPDGTPILPPITGTGSSALDDPRGVAVDEAGAIYVVDRIKRDQDGAFVITDGRVQRFNSNGKRKALIADGGAGSVAVDSNRRVLVGTGTGGFLGASFHVVAYKRSGARIADFGLGRFNETAPTSSGQIAVNDSTGRVYVTDGDVSTGGEVEMFDVVGKLRLVDRRIEVEDGSASVELRCDDGVCEAGELWIDARVKVGRHKRWTTIGEAAFGGLSDGQSTTVEVELSDAGEEAVEESRHGLDAVIGGTGLKPREVKLKNG